MTVLVLKSLLFSSTMAPKCKSSNAGNSEMPTRSYKVLPLNAHVCVYREKHSMYKVWHLVLGIHWGLGRYPRTRKYYCRFWSCPLIVGEAILVPIYVALSPLFLNKITRSKTTQNNPEPYHPHLQGKQPLCLQMKSVTGHQSFPLSCCQIEK